MQAPLHRLAGKVVTVFFPEVVSSTAASFSCIVKWKQRAHTHKHTCNHSHQCAHAHMHPENLGQADCWCTHLSALRHSQQWFRPLNVQQLNLQVACPSNGLVQSRECQREFPWTMHTRMQVRAHVCVNFRQATVLLQLEAAGVRAGCSF